MSINQSHRFSSLLVTLLLLYCGCFFFRASRAEGPGELRVLFLGDDGHHKPEDRFKQLRPILEKKNIDLVYSGDLRDLNPAKLAGFDALLIYANYTRIEPGQEAALLDFVRQGGGFVPIHCASYCFLNSPKYIALVGAQFSTHGTGVFKETIVKPDHPVMKGLEPIESWDETYVHTKHNPDRIVLAERRDAKGAEPYTWVRNYGKGRVFYTAWGHDQRTWGNPNFQALVENGIRWAAENSPTRLKVHSGLKPFEYTEAPAPLPNYVPHAKWGTQAEPIHTMQKPLSPEESSKHLALFPGFSASLVASEPDIYKPIWMDWDERGRLWIAETIDYPNNMQPPGQGHDQIKICEDTDHDGRADKFTVFVDKLSVPTSFVFSNGGIIVVHSGKTEFFKDTNGDDKADERKVLFSGWGTTDTHAGPSNLHYGFDNWIWGTVGYSGFNGTVGGKKIRFGQGIYRFKPDGSELEFVRSSNNNTWGLSFSEDAIVFGSTANGNASMYMPIPNRYYEGVHGWSSSRLETIADSQRFYPLTEKVRQVDYHGSYTAGAGAELYTARSFPPEFWNKIQFVNEPTGHLMGKFHIEPRGSDFISHNGRSFLASDDEWTSPICARVGPDGALWFIDWYNYIIQHNPTPKGFKTGKGNAYDTPLRDKTHGRIYRVTYNAGTPSRVLDLSNASKAALVEALKSNNMLWRMMAQRSIVQNKRTEMVPELIALTKDQSTDELGLNPAAIHALWTLEGLGVLSSNSEAAEAVRSALQHVSPGVRRAAVMVYPQTHSDAAAVLPLLGDSDAQVRLAALLALADSPPLPAAGEAIVAMLQKPENAEDRWISDAAVCAAAKNDANFLEAVLGEYKPTAPKTRKSAPDNLVANSSFDKIEGSVPSSWHTVHYSGRADLQVSDQGHGGGHSVSISSDSGADASWTTQVRVQPRTDYKLSAWIKTANVKKVAGGFGAMLNIHELQDPVHGATKALLGNNPWTQVQLTFNSGEMTEVTVNCLFGGWGRVSGQAWYDDVELAPATGSELAGNLGHIVRLVTTHYAERGPGETIIPVISALQNASPGVAVAILDGLVTGWPEGKAPELSDHDKQSLKSAMQALPESVKDRLLALAQRWGHSEIFGSDVAAITERLRDQISDSSSPDEKRVAAARRLVGLDSSPETIETVLKQISLLSPPELGVGFVNAISESRNPQTARAVLAAWPQMTPSVRRSAVASLIRKPEWAMALLSAVDKDKLSRTDIAPDQWAQLKQNPNRGIARRAEHLSSMGAAISADRQEIVKKLLPLAKESGDPNHGKEVFTITCAVCHTFNGQGGKVGPDLSGIGARDRTEILLDILDPNRSVEANYRLWNVTTKSGDTYSGRLDTETQTSVEILDTTGQIHAIQRKDIASMQASNNSIMPNGFEALPPNDLKSILAYLAGPTH
jgi:putative membrane-bound dehydrogenase-like protein